MNLTALQLFNEFGEASGLLAIKGKASAKITAISPFQKSKQGDLVFTPDQNALEQALQQGASAIVVSEKLAEEISDIDEEIGILISANIGYSHARIKQRYGDHDYSKSGWGKIHPSAIIHPSVSIADDVIVGPNVIIEQGVQIGKGAHLMANVVLEHDARIGDRVRIHPGTIVGWECSIGDDCLILSNTVIGGEGFGYAQDEHFNHHRIPQTGNVIIGNNVTIGANSTIDRGTYGPTTIGNGCIFDNLCHIAHNVTIGENCIGISGFLCAGSSTLGNRVVASGGTMIKDHVTICDDVYLMHRAGVIKDITAPGMYAGGPVMPMKDYVKNNAIYSRLGELRQQVSKLGKIVSEKLGMDLS